MLIKDSASSPLGTALANVSSESEAFDCLLQSLSEVRWITRACLLEFDSSQKHHKLWMIRRWCYNNLPEWNDLERELDQPGKAILDCISASQAVWQQDLPQDLPRDLSKFFAGQHYFVIVPVIAGNNPVGVLLAESQKESEASPELQLAVLKHLCELTGAFCSVIHVQKDRSLILRSNNYLLASFGALNGFLARIQKENSTPSITELDQLLDNMFPSRLIIRMEIKGDYLENMVRVKTQDISYSTPNWTTIETVAQKCRFWTSPRRQRDLSRDDQKSIESQQFKGLLGLPIIWGRGKRLVYVFFNKADPYTKWQVELAAMASNLIEANWRLILTYRTNEILRREKDLDTGLSLRVHELRDYQKNLVKAAGTLMGTIKDMQQLMEKQKLEIDPALKEKFEKAREKLPSVDKWLRKTQEYVQILHLLQRNPLDGALQYTKIDTVNLTELVRGVRNLWSEDDSYVKQKKLGLELIESTQEIEIKTIALLIEETLNNVIKNATYFSLPNEKIKIWIEETTEDDCVHILVENRGESIHYRDKEEIFEAYFTTKESDLTERSGIGLYASRKNMRLLGGDITLSERSRVGEKGRVCFDIRVPKKT